MIEQVKSGQTLLAIIIPAEFREPGIHFFTTPELSQQLGYISHPSGTSIPAHRHRPVAREVLYSQEVLLIKKGLLRVDFYNDDESYLESRVLKSGDVILLAGGGHGFEVLEAVEMIEVKQGPYAGEQDRSRFDSVAREQVRVVE